MKIKYSFDSVKNAFQDSEYNLLTTQSEYLKDGKVAFEDKNGYKYHLIFDRGLMEKKRYLVSKDNKYSLHNINNYLAKNGIHFTCVSDEYLDATSLMEFKCIKCDEIVSSTWSSINRNDNQNRTHVICPNCDGRVESIHALVLKQIFRHAYPDTIEEETSCRNPLTGKIMPTDIVNHRLKIAIEIQSQWHDYEYSKIKDRIKKQFWIDKGYRFYDPDIRDYTVLQMCQLFFDIDELPDYIDYEYSNKINIKRIQDLLNDGFSIPKIEKKTGIDRHRIYDAIYDGKLVRPTNYINACFCPIVQLDMKGNFVREYQSISEVSAATGFNNGAIVTALRKGRHYSNGYLWYKKEEYDPNCINLKSRFSKFYTPVDKFDKDGNYICSYDTIIDASKDCNLTNTQIYNVVIGKRHKVNSLIFRKAL